MGPKILDQLTPEVAEMLKDKPATSAARNALRRMKARRQIEAAGLMLAAENYSKSFAKVLLVATDPADLQGSRIRPIRGLTAQLRGDIQREMNCLLTDGKEMKDYGNEVLRFVAAKGYIAKLINNERVEAYLRRLHPDILQEFRTIVTTASLERCVAERA